MENREKRNVIITGLSGAGISSALKAMEDLRFEVSHLEDLRLEDLHPEDLRLEDLL